MIRVAIVDDQKVVTQGLKALLETEADIEIVGTGSNGQDAIDLASQLVPDVLLIDQHMPLMNGAEATQVICQQCPSVAVLLLSGSDEEDNIAEALQAGAKGYLLKSTSAEDLADSIRSVYRGYSQMGPGLMEKLLAKVNSNGTSQVVSTPPKLSPLVMELQQILNRPTIFEQERFNRLLASVEDPKMGSEMMTQIEQHLQETPNHVPALYLSGQMIGKFQRRSRLGINYLRLAFTHAQTQSFSLAVLLQICNAAWRVDSTEAIRWLRSLLKNWPIQQPYSLFFHELRQVFGYAAEPYRLLKTAWEIDQLSQLCSETSTLKSKLNILGTPVKTTV
ncbi:MAG TPA: response regulator [Stenomitos sp.]